MRCSQNLAAARDCGEPSGKSAGLGSVGLWAPPLSLWRSPLVLGQEPRRLQMVFKDRQQT